MAKEKTIKTKLKSLYNQLKKHDQQPSIKENGCTTLKGKIEKSIKYLEKLKK